MRPDMELGPRYRAILSHTGLILVVIGALMLAPLTALAADPHEWRCVWGFAVPALTLIFLGLALQKIFRSDHVVLDLRDGGIIVLLSWTAACLVSAFPFIALTELDFTGAVFESVSGWTTTGLSVLNVAQAGHTILLWRSVMQLAGGAGLAIITLAAIAGPAGTGLVAAEGRRERLVPQVKKSAKLVLMMYFSYALAGSLAYLVAGLGLFDAVNHAFTAISTGGFSTKAQSIGHFNSRAVEAVSMTLMLLGNLNFVTASLLFTGKLKAVLKNGELRLFAVLVAVSFAVLLAFVSPKICPDIADGVTTALFESVSALTTTGFTTTSYANWPAIGILVIVCLMIVGGGTGSTAGGIKQYRVYILYSSLKWEIRRALLPRSAVVENHIWRGQGKYYVGEKLIRQTGNLVFIYFLSLLLGTSVLTAHGYGLQDSSLLEFASALGTVGLSTGITAAHAPSGVLWTQTAGMFLGRLEFFVIIVSLARMLADIKNAVHSKMPDKQA